LRIFRLHCIVFVSVFIIQEGFILGTISTAYYGCRPSVLVAVAITAAAAAEQNAAEFRFKRLTQHFQISLSKFPVTACQVYSSSLFWRRCKYL